MSDSAYAWGFAHAKNRRLNQALDNIDEANRTIGSLNKRALASEAEVRDLRDALQLEQSKNAGLIGQIRAFMEQHANSPLMADSGKRFADGDIKTKVRLIYERFFDAHMISLKISNPVGRRLN